MKVGIEFLKQIVEEFGISNSIESGRYNVAFGVARHGEYWLTDVINCISLNGIRCTLVCIYQDAIISSRLIQYTLCCSSAASAVEITGCVRSALQLNLQ